MGRYRVSPWPVMGPFRVLFLATIVPPLVYAIYLSLFSQRVIQGSFGLSVLPMLPRSRFCDITSQATCRWRLSSGEYPFSPLSL